MTTTLPPHNQHVAQFKSEQKAYDLVVSLGTDYHHFDRLIGWVEDYLEAHPDVTCLVQHGFTRPARGADAIDRLPRAELLEYYERAKVVLVQGGPGSILDAREVGAIPFAVPRLKKFDEVVDDHQVQFSEVMQTKGETTIIESAADLEDKINTALAHPETVHGTKRVSECDTAALNLEDALEKMQEGIRPEPQSRAPRVFRRFRQVVASFTH